MPNITQIKNVMKKIINYEDIGKHICFLGGSVPYIISGKESNRDHSDIDILVEEEYIPIIRDLLKLHNKYKEELDSLSYNMGDDYGLKVFIDGIYVEFEPMKIENNQLIRKSFSPRRKQFGTETIPFDNIEDLIIPIEIEGISTYVETPEYIKVDKEKYKREKDLMDISFIDSLGINEAKYDRVKRNVDLATEILSSYENNKQI